MKRNLFTILLFICVAATASTALGFRGPYNSAAYVGQPTISNLLIENGLYVDGNRTDSYTEDGGLLRPYKTLLAALAVVNADVGKSWTIYVAPGTYADNLTITGPRHLKIQGTGGVVLSGTILINSGVGSYDRVEFVGASGGRADKGPALTISGKITATRTNDSLIYVGFHGCHVTGQFEATTCGTWVLQYSNCKVDGAITGTFTGTDPDESILIESYGYNKFAGAITGKTSLYNCNGSEFSGNITTTPWYANTLTHCTFGGAVSIIPQGGASSVVTYLDSITYKSLKARTPTLTGVTLSHTDGGIMTGATTEILVGGGDGTNPVWTTATGTGAPVRADSPEFTTKITTPAITAPAASLVIKPTTDAVTAVQVQDKDGNNILNVDTVNNRVGVGTAAPSTIAHMSGAVATYIATVTNTTAGGDFITCIGDAGNPVINLNSMGTGGEGTIEIYSDNVLNTLLSARPTTFSYFLYSLGIGTTTPDTRLHAEIDDATTNATTNVQTLTHTTSGTPAANIGAGLAFEVETAAANNEIVGVIEGIATDVTPTAEQGAIVFKTMTAGAAATEKARVDHLGLSARIPEHVEAATDTLSTTQCYGGLINNYGQAGNVTLTLPAAANGMSFTVILGTTAAFYFRLDPNANDSVYLDGTSGGDGKYVGLAAATVGNAITFQSFQTGAGAYDWYASTISGAWTAEP